MPHRQRWLRANSKRGQVFSETRAESTFLMSHVLDASDVAVIIRDHRERRN